MMEMADVTVLHTLRRGEPELSPSFKAKLSSLGDSSRMTCNDGDPLRVMPPTTVTELASFGDGLKLPKRSMMNSRFLKWMAAVLSEFDVKQKWVLPVGLHR
jgi:hypothetical protein